MADLKTQLMKVFTSGNTYNVLTLLKALIDEMEGITFATPENIQELSDAIVVLDRKINELSDIPDLTDVDAETPEGQALIKKAFNSNLFMYGGYPCYRTIFTYDEEDDSGSALYICIKTDGQSKPTYSFGEFEIENEHDVYNFLNGFSLNEHFGALYKHNILFSGEFAGGGKYYFRTEVISTRKTAYTSSNLYTKMHDDGVDGTTMAVGKVDHNTEVKDVIGFYISSSTIAVIVMDNSTVGNTSQLTISADSIFDTVTRIF